MSQNSKYQIVNIVLIESQFKRDIGINFNSPNLINNVHVEINNNSEKDILSVYLTLKFDTKIDDIEVVQAKVTMLGVFKCTECLELSKDTFAKINAPAIIFPFIREHLSTLSLKAGITPILLPPINFAQLADRNKNNELNR